MCISDHQCAIDACPVDTGCWGDWCDDCSDCRYVKPPPPPSDWSWTTAERNAFNNQGLTTVLTMNRWNAFIDKINEFIAYSNEWWNTNITPLPSSVKMTSNKIMYASRFSSVVYKMRELTETDMGGITMPRRVGDIIKGSYFPYLANMLNALT